MSLLSRVTCRRKLYFVVVLLAASTALPGLAQLLALHGPVVIVLWSLALLGGTAAVGLMALTAGGVLRKLDELSREAEVMAHGDLTGSVEEIVVVDELGQLSRAFNEMKEGLRDTVASVIETAQSVHHDAGELTRAGTASFQRTHEQCAQTHQAASAMQEMSISIAEVSHNAQSAADEARKAAAIAREGGAIVEEMLAGMGSISDSVTQTAETVQRLGRESEQIIRIVNVIEEIAQKTNLLALNAAIEAARAGEQGRGFAVVAGEVRRLAESTRSATSEIAQMIQGIQSHTQEAVEAMGSGTAHVSRGMEVTARAGESLKRIVTAAGQVDAMIDQIATAATEQSVAAQQFSQNLEVINRLGEEHAAAVPITKGLLESVVSGTTRLQEHLAQFHVDPQAIQPSIQPGLARHAVHAFGD
ncbi:MAG TPA: methyl-accepting chemotaxis protein [Acidobacteriaceae bacterium]